jgi:exopolyphosphatase/guanosine-5'-triphosphate,3'-diphosphate pyrophosphatase
MRSVAAVDCGTNSLRLLIARHGSESTLVEVDRQVELVRLGQGVGESGRFHPDALARTLAVVDRYAVCIDAAGVATKDIAFVATSATRQVANREQLFEGVQARLGVTPDVISGQREAELSFVGALRAIRPGADPVLVTDIGGGSTELIVGSRAGQIDSAASLEIGSVRLTERFLAHSPATDAEVAAATAYADTVLDGVRSDLATLRTWIGVGGTFTTLGALAYGTGEDPHRVHGARLSTGGLWRLYDRLRDLSGAQIRRIPGMHPGRADVITGGALIAARLARRLPVEELSVSLADILDGVAWELLGNGTIGR